VPSDGCGPSGVADKRRIPWILPRFSISQVTTLASTFANDIRAYSAAGIDGIGVWELKLSEDGDAEALELLAGSGLGSAAAIPAVPSILPLPLMEGPEEPEARTEAICASVQRLAAFRPSSIVCLTGPGDDRETVVGSLRTIGDEAEQAGVSIGLEPMNRVGAEDWTMITSLPEAVELLEEVDHPAVGIQFDSWHLWNTPDLLDDIGRYHEHFVGVHISDWRDPTRSWADRVLPGEGVANLPAILGALDRVGWDGFYDLEIFSDNGAFGNAWPDSHWDTPAEELARAGKSSFERAWGARIQSPVDQVSPGAV
jgi:sugar phosphate isomerase/epimerase